MTSQMWGGWLRGVGWPRARQSAETGDVHVLIGALEEVVDSVLTQKIPTTRNNDIWFDNEYDVDLSCGPKRLLVCFYRKRCKGIKSLHSVNGQLCGDEIKKLMELAIGDIALLPEPVENIHVTIAYKSHDGKYTLTEYPDSHFEGARWEIETTDSFKPVPDEMIPPPPRICQVCGGSGKSSGCSQCNGAGNITRWKFVVGSGNQLVVEPCTKCSMTGREPCSSCGGRGSFPW